MESPRVDGSEASEPGNEPSSSNSFPEPTAKGLLLVVSGPSGAGKSSVVHGVADQVPFHFSVSATTRAPRPGETEGEDYFFVSRDEFEELIAAGELLEWAQYSGYLYGTPRRPVLEHLERGEHVVLDIENDGAGQVKRSYEDAVLVFIMPPSLDILEQRLRERGDTSPQDVTRRLGVAREQIADAEANFDFLVTNADLDTAISEVVSILSEPENA
jgi:guanylate kinase